MKQSASQILLSAKSPMCTPAERLILERCADLMRSEGLSYRDAFKQVMREPNLAERYGKAERCSDARNMTRGPSVPLGRSGRIRF